MRANSLLQSPPFRRVPAAGLRLAFVGAAALLLALGWPAPSARAAVVTFTVDSSGDADDAVFDGVCATATGVCTLRAALTEAQRVATTLIVVPAMTIALGAPLTCKPDDYSYGGVDVTITGAGREQTVLDGYGVIVGVGLFAHGVASCHIRHLTIRNGASNGVSNGGYAELEDISLEGNAGSAVVNSFRDPTGVYPTTRLTLKDVLIRNNTGGGIWNGGTLTGVNVTILDDSAFSGAALYNYGLYFVLTLDGFLMRGNRSRLGGAVYARQGFGFPNPGFNVRFSRGTIQDNVSECCAPATDDSGGGAVFVEAGAEVTLTDVTLSGNRAVSPGSFGRAIANRGKVSLTRVSLAGNEAVFGGGLYNGNYDGTPANMWLTNVTVSGNAASAGGGVFNTSNGKLVVTNSTVAHNSAVTSGGIENGVPGASSNDVNLRDTILAENTAVAGSPDCSGLIGSEGGNVVGDVSGCYLFAAPGDQVGVDARLQPLQGVLPYHPLLADSPAFQGGSNSLCPPTDQRGLLRPQGSVCDAGAFEVGDAPVVGDWDGNGSTTIRIYRPWEHVWYLRNTNASGVNEIPAVFYGGPDVPVVGDWDGDGVETVGVYRPAERVWYLRNSVTSGVNDVPAILYGAEGDIPLVGDWDGDGIDTIGIYRPSEHVWYLRNLNTSGGNDIPAILYGVSNDLPVAGDWDGNGTTTIGVYRLTERIWYLRNSNTSGVNDIPPALF